MQFNCNCGFAPKRFYANQPVIHTHSLRTPTHALAHTHAHTHTQTHTHAHTHSHAKATYKSNRGWTFSYVCQNQIIWLEVQLTNLVIKTIYSNFPREAFPQRGNMKSNLRPIKRFLQCAITQVPSHSSWSMMKCHVLIILFILSFIASVAKG